MIKLVYCLHRIPALTAWEFQQHWRDHHYQYGARMTGIRRYIQYHRVLETSLGERGDEDVYDGIMNSWWDSLESMKAVFAESPEMADALSDEPYFIDHRRSTAFATEEIVVAEPRAPAPFVLFECRRRRDGTDQPNFRSKVIGLSTPPSREICGLLRNIRLDTDDATITEMDNLTAETTEQPWDAVTAIYFHSTAHARAYLASPAYEERMQSERHLFSEGGVELLTRRHVFVNTVR
jgi:uncharacterized protein (TIGR02118 family)